MNKASFLWLLLFLFTSQNSNAALDSYNIEIRCAQEKPIPATVTIDLESKNWSWQCDDLTPYSYKSDVWVHPGMVTLETANGTYEIDKDVSDEKFNKGIMQSYYNEDVSCGALMLEYEKDGISAFYKKNWSHGTGYDQHGFQLKDSEGKFMILYLSLTSYYASNFTLLNGVVEREGLANNCSIAF